MYRKYFKRPFDIICSFLALIVLSPALLVIAILVRSKLGTPVIFSTERAGRNGTPFMLYKFRSMNNLRDLEGDLLPDTVRLTKFGRKLRAISLDELPEIWNILKGDMSIIGPRPLPLIYLPYYTEDERRRHDVRPGLSGLAQVNGRNSISWERKFLYDIDYIDHISFLGDMKIIFLTIKKVITQEAIGQGEDRPGNLNDLRKNMVKGNGN